MKGTTFLALDPKKSNEIYFIGLIDFLQKYNKKKKLAGFAKSFKYEKVNIITLFVSNVYLHPHRKNFPQSILFSTWRGF